MCVHACVRACACVCGVCDRACLWCVCKVMFTVFTEKLDKILYFEAVQF